ncbi:MAG: NB-ARC domain-containing protein, partial [bacterium]
TITVTGGAQSPVLSPDGNYLLASRQLIEVSTGNQRRDYSNLIGFGPKAFSPDMNRFVAYGERTDRGQQQGEIVEISSGRLVKLEGHINYVTSVIFTNNGKNVLSSSQDGTVRVWDSGTGKEIAKMISFSDGEWIVITPEGYYNSSANGDKHLNVHIGNNVYGIDQYRSAFYKPQIVEAALRLGDSQKAITDVVGIEKEKPTAASIQNIEPPFIVIKSPEDGKKIGSNTSDLSLYVEDRNQTIKKVMVYVNGRVAASGETRGVKITLKEGAIDIPEGKKTLDIKIPISLDIGENLLEVTAFNGFSEGRKSIRIYSALVGQASRLSEAILPNLWILSIGINRYQDKNLTPLSYAVADAEGIIEAFKSQKGRLFHEINSLIISDSSSIKPTYDSILDNLSYLSKASANDIVLLFIAGHGINDDKGDFYFLPADAVIMNDGAIKKSKAIPWRELKAILDLPSKKLIFADTCHSEGVAGKKTRGVDNDRFVKELQEANAVIFTSSRGRELSQESDKWKHGAFTYAIIEGINGKADLIKDNRVSMKELDTYVSETVPKITNGAQHPITNTPDGYVNFPVAVLE